MLNLMQKKAILDALKDFGIQDWKTVEDEAKAAGKGDVVEYLRALNVQVPGVTDAKPTPAPRTTGKPATQLSRKGDRVAYVSVTDQDDEEDEVEDKGKPAGKPSARREQLYAGTGRQPAPAPATPTANHDDRMPRPRAGKTLGWGHMNVGDYFSIEDPDILDAFAHITWDQVPDQKNEGGVREDRLRAVIKLGEEPKVQRLNVTVRRDNIGMTPEAKRGKVVRKVISEGGFAIDFGGDKPGVFFDGDVENEYAGRPIIVDDSGRLTWGEKESSVEAQDLTGFFRNRVAGERGTRREARDDGAQTIQIRR